ncbi:hypothetical protein AVEN_60445-1 [Araneus ventricosus]|uniref:SGNH hydrolase-type esterase domain-containing protein n=1 Tax=Araneus ventricosus TaxID=182803 RepID=A0A4Y2GNX2_ARAVE|nr:hypothetical protein AVEN_60445-1 [Araneus ventricosus]
MWSAQPKRFGTTALRVADVITRGFSGYTSRSARIILPRIFYPENILDVEAFVIFFGTNDLSGKDDAPQYHVPVEDYSENLEEMIKYLEVNFYVL